MLKSGGGSIVHNASVLGIRPYPELSLYNASKFAVIGLTKTAELHERRVRCAMGLVTGVAGRCVRDLFGRHLALIAKKPQPPLHKRIRLRLLVGLTHPVSS
jgi:NAD(P)-dependent dehydrogenase (short-subunit alcohol dehydrogenase family)